MPRIAYEEKKFASGSLAVIRQANGILAEYARQGFDLTLRQLFYQFVARDLFANTQRNYKRLGGIVNDARLAGHIDWKSIVDRTRNIRALRHWNDPAHMIEWAADQFKVDFWADQPAHCEVWIEKDALIGVISGVCSELDVPYFSCRGYVSQSEMWGSAQRLGPKLLEGKEIVIFHLGDHDPSGLDMTRDIEDRTRNFMIQDYLHAKIAAEELDGDDRAATSAMVDEVWPRIRIERLALNCDLEGNVDQIAQYDPPPNPARVTDSRYADYRRTHGDESWELDALEPTVLAALIRNAVEGVMDRDLFDAAVERERDGERLLGRASDEWEDIAENLDGQP